MESAKNSDRAAHFVQARLMLQRAMARVRKARMEQRTKPHVKHKIQRAAALLGADETAFVTNSAYERVRSTKDEHEQTLLADEDRAAFLAALESPAQPSAALREAVATHRQVIFDRE